MTLLFRNAAVPKRHRRGATAPERHVSRSELGHTTGPSRAGAHTVRRVTRLVRDRVTWLLYAIGASIAGLIVGGIIVVIVRRFHKHPEELIVD